MAKTGRRHRVTAKIRLRSRAENGRERRRGYRVDGQSGRRQRACAAGVTIGGLTIPAPPTDAQITGGGRVDAVYILATPEEIGFIKPMIAMRNGTQSGATLYASSRSAQGTSGPDFRLEMEGLQYSEIPMLAGGNMPLMQQALSAVHNDYSLARMYAMGVDAGRWRTTFRRCVRCRGLRSMVIPAH